MVIFFLTQRKNSDGYEPHMWAKPRLYDWRNELLSVTIKYNNLQLNHEIRGT